MSAPVSQRRWSISAVRSYLACPRQYWLTRVARVEREVAGANFRGVLLHAGLAAGYRCGGDEEATVDAIHEEGRRLGVEVEDEVFDTALKAFRFLGPLRGDEVLGVERELEIIHKGILIMYRADVIYRSHGVLTVRDWKSSSTLPRARDLEQDRQLALGALCAARVFNVIEVRVEIASIGAGVAVSALMPMATARAAGDTVAEVAVRIEADREFNARPGAACAACPVRAFCPVYGDGTGATP